MDSTPIPKPRTVSTPPTELSKKPVPLPRSKVTPTNSDAVSASNFIKSLGTASKQFTEDVAEKLQSSAKSANELLEKSLNDSSRYAKVKLEKTLSSSRAVRDSVTKSVIETTKTAGLKLRRSRKSISSLSDNELPRTASLPVVDVSLFDNIQFHSPLLEQKRYRNEEADETALKQQEVPSITNNPLNFDELSLFSSNSDSYTDTGSIFSSDSVDNHTDRDTYDTPKASRSNSISSAPATLEIPERKKKKERMSMMRHNSMYENWILPVQSETPQPVETASRPSISTIFEFDPLNTSAPKYEGVSNELLLLESFLVGDTYGTITAPDTSEDSLEDFYETDYFNPPTPPERSDSLLNSDEEKTDAKSIPDSKAGNTSWFITDDVSKPVEEISKSSSSTVMQRFSNVWENVRNKAAKTSTVKPDIVERPPLNKEIQYHSGMLTRIVSGPSAIEDLFKNCQTRYVVLSEHKLKCYSDSTTTVLKETHCLQGIYSLQIVLPLSATTSNNLYSFEVSVGSGTKSAPRKLVFGCGSASERRSWAQQLAQHITVGFQHKHTTEFTRFGWCYLKEGISGEWRGAWIMLVRRVLAYTFDEDAVKSIDLRKTRCIVSQDPDEESKRRCPADCANLLLDCPHNTLYLRFPHERELKGWSYMLRLAAHNNGAQLHHQQLTADDVPAIVDKCISFIYAYGSMSEGIYRRSGSNSTLTALLAKFRRDAWSVQLSTTHHTEHDVAGVLKRFFRDLPTPLFPPQLHKQLVEATDIECSSSRHAAYRRLMQSQSQVARRTARKLFAHLHFLHNMADKNKMAADNLAAVWTPNLMPGAVTNGLTRELTVVRELISSYEAVWQPTQAERARELCVRRVLERSVVGPPAAPAGHLRAWVSVRDRNTCHQVTLTPSKTCADICIELCEKASADAHLLMLEEVICGERLRRIVHNDEIVLDVFLRWSYWDEEDRKDNYLIIVDNKTLHDMDALKCSISLVCGKLKYAPETSKTFKSHMFELKNGKLCYFKDKEGSQQLEEWQVSDMLWYHGHELLRNPHSRWAITFIHKNRQTRTKERPWFGAIIGGSVSEDQLRWSSAIMFAQHKTILPTPRLIIT